MVPKDLGNPWTDTIVGLSIIGLLGTGALCWLFSAAALYRGDSAVGPGVLMLAAALAFGVALVVFKRQ